MEIGAKFCRKCRKQGLITDSRQAPNGYVRRRYECSSNSCNKKWTTFEYRVEDNEVEGAHTSQQFLESIKAQGAEEARLEIRGYLRKLLGAQV